MMLQKRTTQNAVLYESSLTPLDPAVHRAARDVTAPTDVCSDAQGARGAVLTTHRCCVRTARVSSIGSLQ